MTLIFGCPISVDDLAAWATRKRLTEERGVITWEDWDTKIEAYLEGEQPFGEDWTLIVTEPDNVGDDDDDAVDAADDDGSEAEDDDNDGCDIPIGECTFHLTLHEDLIPGTLDQMQQFVSKENRDSVLADYRRAYRMIVPDHSTAPPVPDPNKSNKKAKAVPARTRPAASAPIPIPKLQSV